MAPSASTRTQGWVNRDTSTRHLADTWHCGDRIACTPPRLAGWGCTMSLWEFIGSVLGSPGLVTFASVTLAVIAIFGTIGALVGGVGAIAWDFGWWWNLLYVPAVLAVGGFLFFLAAWLDTEVAPGLPT